MHEVIEAQIGDLLQVEAALGISHYGIYVGPRWPHGRDVVHADKRSGFVRLDYWEEFGDGRPVYVAAEARSVAEQQAIIGRALAALGQPYSLLGRNCEHVVTYAFTGVPESPGVRTALKVAGVGAFLWWLSEGQN